MKNLIDYRRILRETIEEFMDVSYNDVKQGTHSMHSLYQVAFKDRLPSIFRNGFSIQYAATAGGNFYCTGLYTTFKLSSTIENLSKHYGNYGDTILKIGIESFDRFLIYNEKIAMETYGDKYSIADQLEYLFKDYPDKLNYIKNSRSYDYIINTNHQGYTSDKVQAFLELMGGLQCRCDSQLELYDIRGFIFHGRNDGFVCIIRDYKSIMPLAYSEDGKVWKDNLFSTNTIDNTAKSKDAVKFLGANFKSYINHRFYTMENGWWVVQRASDRKFNLLNDETKKPMSPIWFKCVSRADENGFSLVKDDEGNMFYINEYGIYSKPDKNYRELFWSELE